MTFQFQCPQGHLLEGDESTAGQTCQCPTCGMVFIIPAPIAAPAEPEVPRFGPAFAPREEPAAEAPALPQVGPGVTAPAPGLEQEPQLLHIPCPNGHELETPPDMLNQDVMCPHCGVQFRLRERDSVEFKRRRQQEEQRRIDRIGKLWFNWSVAIAVVVVVFLVVLIVLRINT